VLGSPVGLIALFGFTWALLHHAFGGVRHLVWDLSIAHTYPWREYLTRATLLASLACTALFWLSLALFQSGSP
jgi:succinate dehydrogenase / fumarate reductase cytochrome b subunit